MYEDGRIKFQETEKSTIPSYEEFVSIKEKIDEILSKGKEWIEKENAKKLKEYDDWVDEELGISPRKPKTKQKRKKEWGYAYFFKCLHLYKIGITQDDPRLRLGNYSTLNPFEKEILFCGRVFDYKRIETKIIKKFSHKIKTGKEWLELTEKEARKVVAFLKKKEAQKR